MLERKWKACETCNGSGIILPKTDNSVEVKCSKCKGQGKIRCDKHSQHKILSINTGGVIEHNSIPVMCPIRKIDGGVALCELDCAAFIIRHNDEGTIDFATCTLMGKEILGTLEFTDEGTDEQDS